MSPNMVFSKLCSMDLGQQGWFISVLKIKVGSQSLPYSIAPVLRIQNSLVKISFLQSAGKAENYIHCMQDHV